MNVTQSLIARIEEYRATNKAPCKNYGTERAADAAGKKAAEECARHLGAKDSARYVVFFVPSWGRWVAAIDMSELLRRPGVGGHVGIVSRLGFFAY